MQLFWKKFILFALFFESIIFLMLYCFGPNGLHVLYGLKNQEKELRKDIELMRKDLSDIQEQIQYIQTDFAKEKIARERLLMKKDNETVYFTKSLRT